MMADKATVEALEKTKLARKSSNRSIRLEKLLSDVLDEQQHPPDIETKGDAISWLLDEIAKTSRIKKVNKLEIDARHASSEARPKRHCSL
jgi:hypothetical protein